MEKKDQIDAMFRVFGLPDEDRTPARMFCLARIVDKFDFETEMYVYACQLALDKSSDSRIKYVENLLEYWKFKGINTVSEAKADIQNNKNRRLQSRGKLREIPTGTLQFRNFTERTNNNYMEKILKQYSK